MADAQLKARFAEVMDGMTEVDVKRSTTSSKFSTQAGFFETEADAKKAAVSDPKSRSLPFLLFDDLEPGVPAKRHRPKSLRSNDRNHQH